MSEAWAEANLYCPSCSANVLARAAANTPVVDLLCPECKSSFQLKSQAHRLSNRITDAAYDAMYRTIVEGRTPNLLALHYLPDRWEVRNLVLVPRFALSLSCLEKRKPLSPSARRQGWVGCNILMGNIPSDARIAMVEEGVATNPASVRRRYDRLRPLQALGYEARGWTLDVLNVVRSLGKSEFLLSELYRRDDELQRLHPANLHVRDKIRQQLQRLRDLGLVEFLGGGMYRVKM